MDQATRLSLSNGLDNYIGCTVPVIVGERTGNYGVHESPLTCLVYAASFNCFMG